MSTRSSGMGLKVMNHKRRMTKLDRKRARIGRVEQVHHTLAAQRVFGCPVLDLDNGFGCHTGRWCPAVDKNVVAVWVGKDERGVFF